MAHSDSDGEEIDDLEFENGTSDADGEDDAEVDDDILDNDADDVTEGDDVCYCSYSTLFTGLTFMQGLPLRGFG